jgi:hypothetical protein
MATAANYYEAYVYEIKIFKDEGTFYYVGWHLGLISDAYLCSASDPDLKEDYANFDHEFNVIKTGSAFNMAYLEWKMLSKVDAKNNPFYYNKSNGGGKYLKKHGNIMMIDKLEEEIKAKYYLVESTPLSKFEGPNKIRPYQIRDKEGTVVSHVTTLSQKIDALEGDMYSWEPIVIFKDMDGPGKDVLGQGNHTTTAAIKSSKNYKISDIPTQEIPKSVWSKLSEFELLTLLSRLNPLPEKPSLPTSDTSAIQWLVNNFKNNGVPINSDSNTEELKKWGFSVQKITKGLMTAAVTAMNNKNGLKPGHIIIDYTKGEAKQLLDNALAENTGDNEFAMAWPSSWLKWDKIMNDYFPLECHKDFWTIYIFHKSNDDKNQWEDTEKGEFKKYKKTFDILSEKFDIQIEWVPLPFSKKNPLLNIKKKVKKKVTGMKKAA